MPVTTTRASLAKLTLASLKIKCGVCSPLLPRSRLFINNCLRQLPKTRTAIKNSPFKKTPANFFLALLSILIQYVLIPLLQLSRRNFDKNPPSARHLKPETAYLARRDLYVSTILPHGPLATIPTRCCIDCVLNAIANELKDSSAPSIVAIHIRAPTLACC